MKNNFEARKVSISIGGSVGTALAVSISWGLHQSILWAMLHGILSWFYVIYYAIIR